MHLWKRVLSILIVSLAVLSARAGTSKIVVSWKNPVYTSDAKLHHVLALGLSNRTKIRADFEDALSSQLANLGVEATPGNAILLRPEGSKLDLDYLKSQVRTNKFEAVVVSRLIKVDESVTRISGTPYIVPFPYYNSFYGYYGAVYPVVYSPDYLKQEIKVRIETNLYAVSSGEGQLVWVGITDTFDPSNVDKAIDRLVKLLVKQMGKDGVL